MYTSEPFLRRSNADYRLGAAHPLPFNSSDSAAGQDWIYLTPSKKTATYIWRLEHLLFVVHSEIPVTGTESNGRHQNDYWCLGFMLYRAQERCPSEPGSLAAVTDQKNDSPLSFIWPPIRCGKASSRSDGDVAE